VESRSPWRRRRLRVCAGGLVEPPDVNLAEREVGTHQLASLEAPDRLGAADIDTLLNEFGGLTSVIADATSPAKANLYGALELHLVDPPDQLALGDRRPGQWAVYLVVSENRLPGL